MTFQSMCYPLLSVASRGAIRHGTTEYGVNEREELEEDVRGAYIGNRVSFGPHFDQKRLFCEQK